MIEALRAWIGSKTQPTWEISGNVVKDQIPSSRQLGLLATGPRAILGTVHANPEALAQIDGRRKTFSPNIVAVHD